MVINTGTGPAVPDHCHLRVSFDTHHNLDGSPGYGDSGGGPWGMELEQACRYGNNKITIIGNLFVICLCKPVVDKHGLLFTDEKACNLFSNGRRLGGGQAGVGEGSPEDWARTPTLAFTKCYDLGYVCPKPVLYAPPAKPKCSGYLYNHRFPLKVNVGGCGEEYMRLCRCMSASLMTGSDPWARPMNMSDDAVRSRAEFARCVDNIRGDGDYSSEMPDCIKDAVKAALDELMSPETPEGLAAALALCKGEPSEDKGTPTMGDIVGTIHRENQATTKQNSMLPRGGIYGN